MKYNININQKAIIDNEFDIDIIDAAIFELLKDFAHSPKCKKMLVDGETYYIFSWKLVKQQLPLLGLNTKAPIHKRYNKLINADLLERYEGNEIMMQPLYKFGKNYTKMMFLPVSENSKPVSNETHPPYPTRHTPVSNEIPNNIPIGNNNNNKNNTSKAFDESEFNSFWTSYGLKKDKAKCMKKWKSLSNADKKKIFETLQSYKNDTRLPYEKSNGNFLPLRKHPLTYLNSKTWEDYLDKTPINGGDNPKRLSFSIKDKLKQSQQRNTLNGINLPNKGL